MVVYFTMNELLIADDHPLFREALHGLIAKLYPSAAIYEADHVNALYALVEDRTDADLLLLDLNMPGASGYSALMHIRSHYPLLPVAIISAYEDPALIQRALDYGALGFIPKSVDSQTLSTALEDILAGNTWVPDYLVDANTNDYDAHEAINLLNELTPQQFKVLQMVSTGLLNKQIAHELGVSEATIKTHMTAILRKLGATNRTQAVLIANQLLLHHKTQEQPF